ncbi:MAG: alpha/beta hydrolase [Chromatocurvus sp.]
MTALFFRASNGTQLAYRYRAPRPGSRTFVWLSGFKSDMNGTKVLALERWAASVGQGFLAFDYSGHGSSGGAFEDGTISRWRQDTLDAIDALTSGPLVLVGSSMGGWMALLAALARVDRVSALVLVAPAPDFTEKLLWAGLPEQARAEILEQGFSLRPSDYDEPYRITRGLIEDGRHWQVLDAPLAIDCPVRILQGMQDDDVPWQHAQRLAADLESDDVVLTLVKDGDHRLSRAQDIARLQRLCEEVAG